MTKKDHSEPDELAQGLLNDRFMFIPEGDDLTPERREQADFTLKSWRDDFYEWRGGCYYRVTDNEIKRLISKHILELNDALDPEDRVSITSQRINNVIHCLKGRIGLPETKEANTWNDNRAEVVTTLSFKNTLVMFDRKNGSTTVPHTPHYFTLNQLPYDYDPEAGRELWEAFISDSMQNRQDYIDLLQQFVGYLFRPDLKEQKFLLCYGEGAMSAQRRIITGSGRRTINLYYCPTGSCEAESFYSKR